ncbi:accessory egulator protein B [Anaerotignum neopropionicum]|uniref:Accessory egulator protein B n=1 Tax=Anaerotignum neopropionicum TaxID=36847 RepID=A0A136WCE1_9FIRM|nr:accessory gene regulator B family protein [Anaerotignum neopropionicum]KXL52181.1 accessory egulator protein B [Anaerotignum neopropionicum]
MFTKQMEKLADVLIKNDMTKGQNKEVIVYGLSVGTELAFNIITTVVLGIMFGLVLESLVFLGSFSFIRTYAGGYHCKKAINCYLMSSGVIILVLGVIKFTPEGYMLFLGVAMLLIAIPVLLKLAPAETPSTEPEDVEIGTLNFMVATGLIVVDTSDHDRMHQFSNHRFHR